MKQAEAADTARRGGSRTAPTPALRSWKPYPEYKDSGVEWLGEIPGHWKVTLLKREYSVQLGKMLQSSPETGKDTLEPYLRAANIFWTGVDLSDVKEMWLSPYEKELYSLEKGDLLVSEGGDVGRTAIWKGELDNCYIQNAINRVRSKGSHSTTFLYYWIYALKHLGYIDILCNKATISHFTAEKVENILVILPPLSEQHAIATFLDRETAKIDALIAKKERLLELLTEKRTALISHAVTKGLDPNVPMKDSGIEWLGEMPAHWEVMPLKRMWRRCDYGLSESLSGEGEIRVLTMGHVQDGEILLPSEGSLDEVPEDLLLDHGDLLFNRTNSRDLVAKVGIFRGNRSERISFASYLVRLTACEDVNPEYLNYLLNSNWVLSKARSIALLSVNQANLNPTKYGQIFVLIPPKTEQECIVAMLNDQSRKIQAFINKIREGTDRLKEYRTALISAAVTGKIDVREETA